MKINFLGNIFYLKIFFLFSLELNSFMPVKHGHLRILAHKIKKIIIFMLISKYKFRGQNEYYFCHAPSHGTGTGQSR